jgi:hypothetical protein
MIPKISSALALALAFAHPAAPPSSEPDLAAVRAATARFQDVKVALAEGYMRDPENMCITSQMMGQPAQSGAMGIHFFRPDLLGITAPPNPRVNGNGTHTDFRKPAILILRAAAGWIAHLGRGRESGVQMGVGRCRTQGGAELPRREV